MFYTVTHETRFRYSAAIRESVMEVRMQPRSEGVQRCLSFSLDIRPRPRYTAYNDCWGNVVHYFDIPGTHQELEVTARAIIEMEEPAALPEALAEASWERLDELVAEGDFLDYLMPSRFARSSPALQGLMEEMRVRRRDDPLSLMRELTTAVYAGFQYLPRSTRVDSPIDDALQQRSGVCQDFTHILIALGRELGIPSRYVSGYIYQEAHHHDRSVPGATHAWMEAFLPELGWIGFDPTNDGVAAARHIRTAVGRDYADVPPTRGVYKGKAETELSVKVEVERTVTPSLQSIYVAPILLAEVSTPVSAAVWPPPSPLSSGEVTEQAQQQQQ